MSDHASPRSGVTLLPLSPLILAGILAGVGAAAANLLLANIASAIFSVSADFRPITPPAIIAASVGGGLSAACTYGLLERFSAQPERTFNRLALGVLLLSLILPASQFQAPTPGSPGVGLPIVATLMLMHAIVALISVRAVHRLRQRG